MTDAVFHAGQEPVQHGNQWGPSAVKGFGLARDFIARISAPDYSPWRMAALHTVDQPVQPEILVEKKPPNRQCRPPAKSVEELRQRAIEYNRRKKEKRHAENPSIKYQVKRTPEERKILARERDQARREKARKAAASVQVYAYPRLPNGRFMPKKPGEVWIGESFSASCQKQKTATGSN